MDTIYWPNRYPIIWDLFECGKNAFKIIELALDKNLIIEVEQYLYRTELKNYRR